MNDFITGANVGGEIRYHGEDLYDSKVDAAEVRRRIGMVFQKPNPFPKSIFDNVAYGPRINRLKGNMADLVEEALTRAALWDEVKDKLKKSAYALSGGQQQRLCIARTLAVKPDVVLMDEPCSALDPIATSRIEDLMVELKRDFTIVIVTHNMQQAARVSDMTAFFTTEVADDASRTGRLVEFDRTETIFTSPFGSTDRGLHHRPLRMTAVRSRAAPSGRAGSMSPRTRASGGIAGNDSRPEDALAMARPFVEALRALGDAVIVVDAAGTELLRNEAAARFRHGRHSDALAEEQIDQLLDRARHGQSGDRELQLFGPPREILSLRAQPLLTDGKIVGAVVFIRDISESRRKESVRRDFVANVSHELKTPIGALALLAETMAAGGDEAVVRQLADRVAREADRLGRIIDDLLNLSLIEAQESPSREPVPIPSSSRRRSRRCRPAAAAAGIPLEIEGELPDADDPVRPPAGRRARSPTCSTTRSSTPSRRTR